MDRFPGVLLRTGPAIQLVQKETNTTSNRGASGSKISCFKPVMAEHYCKCGACVTAWSHAREAGPVAG